MKKKIVGNAAKWRREYTSNRPKMYNKDEIAKKYIATNLLIDELFHHEIYNFD